MSKKILIEIDERDLISLRRLFNQDFEVREVKTPKPSKLEKLKNKYREKLK